MMKDCDLVSVFSKHVEAFNESFAYTEIEAHSLLCLQDGYHLFSQS
jgi:hypothetical protein